MRQHEAAGAGMWPHGSGFGERNADRRKVEHPFQLEGRGLPVQAVMLSRGETARCGAPGELLTPQTMLDVYGVNAAVVETADLHGNTVKTIAVLSGTASQETI